MKMIIKSITFSCISRLLFFIFFLSIGFTSHGQILNEWHGSWSGTMFIYSKGIIRDSVVVVLTVAPINDSTLTWKTEYKSISQPVVKDYKMKLLDAEKGIYGTDEGNGLVLNNYLIDKVLYSVFQVQGILLTAIYRLEGDQIVFEVTSGKKDTIEMEGVSNYAVSSVQKVQLKRQSVAGSNNPTVDGPLYFLEGKAITKSEMEKIDPQSIDSVHVLKGEEAIKAYGPKAQNGVILIKRKMLR